MGVQLGIFTQISQNPEHGVTAQEISERSGASPIVVGKSRICTYTVVICRSPNEPCRSILVMAADMTCIYPDQFLRLLAVTGYVDQHDAQRFKPSVRTMVMADANMEATTRAW
jgi:hypothetical protein